MKELESKNEQDMVQSILESLYEKELVTPRTFTKMKFTDRERRLAEARPGKAGLADRMELRHLQVSSFLSHMQ